MRPGHRLRADHHQAACEFDYSGTGVAGCSRPRIGSSWSTQPGHDHDRPRFAGATYVEPITPEFVEKVIAHERPDALLATSAARPRQLRGRPRRERRAREVRRGADRRLDRGDRPGENRRSSRRSSRTSAARSPGRRSATPWTTAGRGRQARLPDGGHPGFTWAAWVRDGVRRDRPAPHRRHRPGRQPDREVPPRGVDLGWKEYELEVMRDTRTTW